MYIPEPPCPVADAADREAARLQAHHPEQAWALLDIGAPRFLPDGRGVAPHRAVPARAVAA
ncbi:DUF5999 family protein [Streptomyces albus]|uniref:DUF5999 family protein n=1 Tax=Streptomyces sp. NRRL F-5917 TaxID=1463873 RepID=UPI0004C29B4B|nr:DUF5999 family protein [Streptomyces sp. NRRL F-5917]